MASPTKRRKNTFTAPQQVRNLDFFFEKQRQAAASVSQAPAKKPDLGIIMEGLTDEEYARKLSEEWAKEDGKDASRSWGVAKGSKQGVKRRRDHSPAFLISTVESAVDDIGEGRPPETTPDQNIQTTSTASQTPKKTAISLEPTVEWDTLIEEIPFDKDPLSFDPDKYRGIVDKWPARKAPYALLTRAFVLVNSTRSRIKIVDTLVNLIRTLIRLDPESLLAAVCFTLCCLEYLISWDITR